MVQFPATREMVERSAALEFPNATLSEVLAMLDRYGIQSYKLESDRVQVAILNVSKSNSKLLQNRVNFAKSDSGDILVAAKYSRARRDGSYRRSRSV
jgi:hypothetical protein